MNSGTLLPILATIIFQKGPLAGKTFRVDKSVITIGRNPNNDIVIPDPKVSRNQARISLHDDAWSIENFSQNSLITIDQRLVERGDIQHNTTVGLGDDSAFLFLLSSDETVIETVSITPSAQFERLPDSNFRSYLFDALVDGRFRGENVDHANVTYRCARHAHHVKWSPKRDINSIQGMPVVVERSRDQRLKSTEARNNEAQRCVEELENGNSRCVVNTGFALEVTNCIHKHYSQR